MEISGVSGSLPDGIQQPEIIAWLVEHIGKLEIALREPLLHLRRM